MPHYENACIYKIKHNEDYDDENIYIGSTCDIINRKYRHKTHCNNEKSSKYNYPLYQYIRENGGWDNWIMIKIHDYKCSSKSELGIEERRVLDLLKANLNKQIPTRTNKEYREDNREKLAEKSKEYREANREKIAEKSKEYREANREKITEKKKEYREANKDIIREKKKQYREANKEYINERDKQYNKANKETISERRKQKCECDICGAEVTKSHLARHKKTNKCLSAKK